MIASLARNKNSFNKKKEKEHRSSYKLSSNKSWNWFFAWMKCSMFIVQTPHQTHKGNGCVLFEIESKILLLLETSDLT